MLSGGIFHPRLSRWSGTGALSEKSQCRHKAVGGTERSERSERSNLLARGERMGIVGAMIARKPVALFYVLGLEVEECTVSEKSVRLNLSFHPQ